MCVCLKIVLQANDESGKGGICISGCDDANFLVERCKFSSIIALEVEGETRQRENWKAVDQNVKVFSGAS